MDHLNFDGLAAYFISVCLFGVGLLQLFVWILMLYLVRDFQFGWGNIVIILINLFPFAFVSFNFSHDWMELELMDLFTFWYAIASFAAFIYLLYHKSRR